MWVSNGQVTGRLMSLLLGSCREEREEGWGHLGGEKKWNERFSPSVRGLKEGCRLSRGAKTKRSSAWEAVLLG